MSSIRTDASSAAPNNSVSSTLYNLSVKQKYIEQYVFPYCEESSKYEKVAKIGQGTFG